MLAHRHLILFLMFVSSVALVNADPLTLYANTDSNQFGTVNLVTGAFTLIADQPTTLYGMAYGTGGFFGLEASGELDSIDANTGALTNIGDTGTDPSAIAEIGSTVYIMDTNQNLYVVDTSNGAATLVGSTGIPAVNGSYNSSLQAVGGNLYYTFDQTGTTPELYLIDPATGVATPVGPTLANLDAAVYVNGTDYVFQNSGASPSTTTEYSLDLTSGATVFSANVDSSATGFNGVAPTPTPEPASVVPLVGFGIAIYAFRLRRQRHAR